LLSTRDGADGVATEDEMLNVKISDSQLRRNKTETELSNNSSTTTAQPATVSVPKENETSIRQQSRCANN